MYHCGLIAIGVFVHHTLLIGLPLLLITQAGSRMNLVPSFLVILSLTCPPDEHCTCRHSTFLYLPNAINCNAMLWNTWQLSVQFIPLPFLSLSMAVRLLYRSS